MTTICHERTSELFWYDWINVHIEILEQYSVIIV
jgi:hypothetical protein